MSVTSIGQELAILVKRRVGPKAFNKAVADGTSIGVLLSGLPSLAVGQSCDLRIDTASDNDTTLRVWQSRCGLADGEPFENTLYLEEYDGRWVDLGYFDGDYPIGTFFKEADQT